MEIREGPDKTEPERAPRWGFQFSLLQLFAVVTACCLAMGVAVLWIGHSRRQARRNACTANMRQLGLGVMNYESALGRFPLATDAEGPLAAVPPGTLGTDKTNSSGYGFHIKLLPYVQEGPSFCELLYASKTYTERAFDPKVVRSETDQHLATLDMPKLRCPAYRGGKHVDTPPNSEYASLALPGGKPAAATYVAMVGTHIDNQGAAVENGIVVSRCARNPVKCECRGVTIRQIRDGTAKTLLFCETRETVYASWYDGQAAWVVGVDPWIAKSDDGFFGATKHLINVGSKTGNSQEAYSTVGLLGGTAWPGALPRQWGPSSQHDGVVMHVFADGRTQAISDQADPTVYYRLITRNGGEPVDRDDL